MVWLQIRVNPLPEPMLISHSSGKVKVNWFSSRRFISTYCISAIGQNSEVRHYFETHKQVALSLRLYWCWCNHELIVDNRLTKTLPPCFENHCYHINMITFCGSWETLLFSPDDNQHLTNVYPSFANTLWRRTKCAFLTSCIQSWHGKHVPG